MKKIKKKYIITIANIIFYVVAASAQNVPIQCEDTCSHIHGIDLSHYQGDVFWEAIGDNSKMAYVYLKATEGGDRIDDTYEHNIELAHKYGLKVGSYHFFRPKTDLKRQFENFKTQCQPRQQDLIPMIDVETKQGLGTEEFCDSLAKFLFMIEDYYHQKPLVYTGTNFYNHYLAGRFTDYKFMIAQYSSNEPVLSDGHEYLLWQYTGKGHIDGIRGFVDKSRFMGRHGLRELRYRRH